MEPGFFAVPGVPARFGRVLDRTDAGTDHVVVNDLFWRGALGGDPHAIGRIFRFGDTTATVVGVLAPGLSIPGYLASTESLYRPLERHPVLVRGDLLSNLMIVARLRPGVTLAQAQAEARAVFAHDGVGDYARHGSLVVQPYSFSLVWREQPALYALLAACALLLLIACVNWANLQIGRAAARTAELGLRAALGATRARLLRQLATESIAVSLLGAGLELFLAHGLVTLIRTAYGTEFQRFDELALHPAAFAACAGLAVLTGLLAALAPSAAALRIAGNLRPAHAPVATRRSRLAPALVAGEVALTCVLLVCAGLFLRTFRTLVETPLGFDPHHITTATLTPLDFKESVPALKLTYDRVLARLARIPGVEMAATQTSFPFAQSNLLLANGFRIQGRPQTAEDSATVSLLSPGWAALMRVRPSEGRFFRPSDTATAPRVCLIDQSFARRFFPGGHAVGQSVLFKPERYDDPEPDVPVQPYMVVGVLPDVYDGHNLFTVPAPTLFFPYAQYPLNSRSAHGFFGVVAAFAVRSDLPAVVLEPQIRAALAEAAPDLVVGRIATLDSDFNASLLTQRLALRLASGFGLLALALAAVGIYGVLASSVAQRTRELGIRLALGSSRRAAMLLILKQAGSMVALGLAAGLFCAWPAGRAIRAFLYGVTPADPIVLLGSMLALLLVAFVAAVLPARRATRIDPVEALRAE